MGNPRGGLDEQIEQLLQCKPLVEPEVPLVSPPPPPPRCPESWVLDFACFLGGSGWFLADRRPAGRMDRLPASLNIIEKNEPLALYEVASD